MSKIFEIILVALVLATHVNTIPCSYKNWIINGDFSVPYVGNEGRHVTRSDGWVGDVEIGSGRHYGSQWGQQQVAELDIVRGKLADFKQEITGLCPGQYYTLKFEYAPRDGYESTSGFDVYWNNIRIVNILWAPHHKSYWNSKVQAQAGVNTLRIVGTHVNNGAGMIVDKFTLHEDCSQVCNPPGEESTESTVSTESTT